MNIAGSDYKWFKNDFEDQAIDWAKEEISRSCFINDHHDKPCTLTLNGEIIRIFKRINNTIVAINPLKNK